MTQRSTDYQPLGGKGRSSLTLAIGETYRLYLGKDHLLYVINQRFSESYRRFYLRDIQALTLRQTAGRATVNQFLGGLWILAILLSLYIGAAASPMAGWVVGGSITALLLVLCIVNTAKGPTCSCELRTAVSVQELGSLRRVRKAQKILDRLALLVSETQGTLTEDELLIGPRVLGRAPRTVPVARPAAVGLRKRDDGRYHAILFSLLLLDGGMTALNLFVQHLVIILAEIGLSLAIILAIVAVLVRQRDHEIGLELRRVLWATLGYLGVAFTLGYAFYMSMVIRHPEMYEHQGRWVKYLSEVSRWDTPFHLAVHIFTLVGSVSLGGIGFVLLRQHRGETRAPIAPAETEG